MVFYLVIAPERPEFNGMEAVWQGEIVVRTLALPIQSSAPHIVSGVGEKSFGGRQGPGREICIPPMMSSIDFLRSSEPGSCLVFGVVSS